MALSTLPLFMHRTKYGVFNSCFDSLGDISTPIFPLFIPGTQVGACRSIRCCYFENQVHLAADFSFRGTLKHGLCSPLVSLDFQSLRMSILNIVL